MLFLISQHTVIGTIQSSILALIIICPVTVYHYHSKTHCHVYSTQTRCVLHSDTPMTTECLYIYLSRQLSAHTNLRKYPILEEQKISVNYYYSSHKTDRSLTSTSWISQDILKQWRQKYSIQALFCCHNNPMPFSFYS